MLSGEEHSQQQRGGPRKTGGWKWAGATCPRGPGAPQHNAEGAIGSGINQRAEGLGQGDIATGRVSCRSSKGGGGQHPSLPDAGLLCGLHLLQHLRFLLGVALQQGTELLQLLLQG